MYDKTAQVEEPKGIPFFSIATGETHYCKLEPTIAAYINSSDMGINASRGQDYGWRLGADWVKRIRAFKRDRNQVSILTAKNSGQKPTTVQILYHLYGEELAEYFESMEEFENPYEEQYRDSIAGGGAVKTEDGKIIPAALADFLNEDIEDEDDITDLIDDAVVEDELDGAKQPPVDNANVADGAEKFDDKTVADNKTPKAKQK